MAPREIGLGYRENQIPIHDGSVKLSAYRIVPHRIESPHHGTARVSKPEWSLGPSDVMKMIAMQPPYSALNPDREGGDMARTTLRFRVIFDGADTNRSNPHHPRLPPPPIRTGMNAACDRWTPVFLDHFDRERSSPP